MANGKAFQPISISLEDDKDSIRIWVLSDELQAQNAQLRLKLMDFDGKSFQEWQQPLTIAPNQSKYYLTLAKTELLALGDPKDLYLYAELYTAEQKIAEQLLYFLPFKKLNLPVPELEATVIPHQNQFEVVLKTKNFAKDVFLSANSSHNFSANYFDMLPQSERHVFITKDQSLESFQKELKVMTLVDTYKDEVIQGN